MSSIRDLFPPEAQHLLGILALCSTGIGLVLWLTGVRIARVFVALFLGAAGAMVGVWQLSQLLGITPVTAGILGFVAGVLAGALMFKMLQALVLALCIGVATAGVYYNWHAAASQPSVQIASTAATSTSAPAETMLVQLKNETPPTTAAATASAVVQFYKKVADRWNAVPAKEQRPIMVFSLSAAVVTLLLAFSYPRPTTWLTTAAIGSLMFFGGLRASCQAYAPQYDAYFPSTSVSRYITLALMISLGLLVQYKFFWPKPVGKKEAPRTENPIYRGPENT